jgi:hypothetical protein
VYLSLEAGLLFFSLASQLSNLERDARSHSPIIQSPLHVTNAFIKIQSISQPNLGEHFVVRRYNDRNVAKLAYDEHQWKRVTVDQDTFKFCDT